MIALSLTGIAANARQLRVGTHVSNEGHHGLERALVTEVPDAKKAKQPYSDWRHCHDVIPILPRHLYDRSGPKIV